MKSKVILNSQKYFKFILNLRCLCNVKKKLYILFFIFYISIFTYNSFSQSVGIGATSFTPDVSAILEVNSVTQGMLVPRMTQAQRDAINFPAKSLLIYQIDGIEGYYYNEGSPASPNWVRAIGPTGATGITGATGVTGATGITGATGPLVAGISGQTLRYNGTDWVANSLLYNNGTNVGIGTTSPSASAKFEVSSTTQGMLIPRLTNSQRTGITSPANGLIIYNTDCANIQCYDGTQWVNVYTNLNNILAIQGTIAGSAIVCANQTGVNYSISAVAGATSYNWTLPPGATTTAGAGTNSITVTFGTNAGNVCVSALNNCGASGASCTAVSLGNANIAGQAVGVNSSNFGGPLTVTVFTDGVVNTYAGYTLSDAGGTVGLNFGSAVTIRQIRFYSLAATERIKDFKIERYNSGSWTKVSITGASDNATIINGDEGEASNANG